MKMLLIATALTCAAFSTAQAQSQSLSSASKVTLSTLAPHALEKDLSSMQIREINDAVEDGATVKEIRMILGH